MSRLREVAAAAALTLSFSAIVFGVSQLSVAAAWVVGGVLGAVLVFLVAGE